MRNGLDGGQEQDDGMADRKFSRFENRLRIVATSAVVSDPIKPYSIPSVGEAQVQKCLTLSHVSVRIVLWTANPPKGGIK